MEHIVLVALFLVGLYVVDRRDRMRHVHEHEEHDHIEVLAQYHVH